MRTIHFKSAMLKSLLAATVLVSAAGAASAQQVVNLTAAPSTTTLSDGTIVPMWGFSCGTAVTGSTASCAALNTSAGSQWTPVVITVPSGQALKINLTNNLSFANGNKVPTSLVIAGQLGGGLGTPLSVPSPDHSGVRTQTWSIATGASAPAPAQGSRVQSFGTEVTAGTTATLCWGAACSAGSPPLQPGTYLIQSGTHPSIQVPMGLYGILVVTDAVNGVAYPAVKYSADIPLLFSEIDPVQNTAVSTAVNTVGFSETKVWSGLPGGCGNPLSATGTANTAYNTCYPPTVNYTPLYYLINGRGFDTTNAAASLYPVNLLTGATGAVTGNVLVRLVNAGLKMHVPAIVGTTTGTSTPPAPGMTLIAEDGNVLPGKPRIQNEVFMAAGKTQDVMINVPAAGTPALAIYDRQLSLSANATGRNGGMLAYIGINGAGVPAASTSGAASANPDTYNALVPGQKLVVSDPAKGVIANDVRVSGVTLLKAPAGGTVVLNANGTFVYTPNAGTTSDSFTYCANSTASGGACPSNVTATVTLGASALLTDPNAKVACATNTFNANTSVSVSIKTPGVLAACTDGTKLPLSVDPATVKATGMTVVADASGGFTATLATPCTAAAGCSASFTFQAKNTVGLHSTDTSVTVNFPAGSGLAVAVVDGSDHKTPITDYRWIIEEDRTFYVDPACTTNPLPAGCPTISSSVASPINYGTNFHTSSMPVVAAGCTGPLSCEAGQTLQKVPTVCDVGNGVCRPGTQQAMVDPSQVKLDPSKRYYISVLPGDAANPFNKTYTGAPDCSSAGIAAGKCGHGMGGAPIAAACGPQSASDPVTGVKPACSSTSAPAAVTVLAVPTPLPSATLTVIVYQDDYPLNGEQGTGGGVDVLAPQEAGLGDFQITIFDQAGQTGAATGTPTFDMSNEPLSNALAGTLDPVTGLDACPISSVASANSAYNTKYAAAIAFNNANAAAIAAGTTQPKLDSTGAAAATKSTATGMIVTCPKFESDGRTLSPLAGQAVVKNLYPGRYGIAALPGASRIARGEEWLQTNTLDGQKAHDSFMRVGEPGYFQEFGPAGYHVSIGMANPKIINERRYNDSKSGMCDTGAKGGNLACGYEVTGRVTGSRLSRTPDSRLYSSGGRESLAFTQCYVALGDPDGAEIAFAKCDADGYFDFKGIPAGNWKVTTFDQWNDQIIDGITQPVSVGCSGNAGGLCTTASGASGSNGGTTANATCGGPTTTATICDMGEIGVHQWQADLYTRTFIDTTGTGLSDDTGTGTTKPGLALAATNVRFRDGSFSDFNNTDLNGYANFNEIFPLFNWYVVETDSTRYKTTGVHVIYDAGGPADGSKSCNNTGSPLVAPCGSSTLAKGLANTYEKNPLPADLSVPGAVYCANADCFGQSIAKGPVPSGANSTGRIDPPFWFDAYGWQGYIGQGNFLEFGKKPFAAGETGPIHGHVVYASTRPFDNPQLLLQTKWEPLVAHVKINLYKEGVAADGVTPTLTLVDHTETSSWDDWVQGFRPDGTPNMNCPGQQGATDPFYYALQNQPQYLDWYNNVLHGNGTATPIPHNSQFKCYDGMHTWNQLQPAPYDGMYSFPSVTAIDPKTGKPSATNCTGCVPNPDTTDPFRVGQPMLPAGKYVVEVVVPPGYELVKEEDKNILIGDNFIGPAALQFPNLGSAVYILPDQAELAAAYNPLNPQNQTYSLGRNPSLPSHEGDTGSVETYWPCVGQVRQVPDYISLFPQSLEVAPFAGAYRPLCDRKEVTLNEQTSALAKFYIFTSTHVSSHFQGIILDDFAAEFDPFSPQFGEKFAPSYLPVAVKDWTGNPINRVYSDQFGLYNGLNYSTWEVNPPNPTGYAPTMMVMCMNDAGMTGTPDPLFQPGYSQFCYELPFMPGQTGYFDTPVVPVQAFASGSYNRADCSYPDATPAVASVTGDVAGPWVSAPNHVITINALGNQSVDWYGYTGPSVTKAPYNQAKITRHYGFGVCTLNGTGACIEGASVTIGGQPAVIQSWTDTTITVAAPANVPACAVQQSAAYNGSQASCGQLVITTAAGKQSVDTVTVTIGGKQPTVLASGATIQSAIDAAMPGDMIIVPPGTYNEMVVMWKPVRLQGVGAASSIVDANTQPAGKLLNPWRQRMVCLFGLDASGRPSNGPGNTCPSGLMYAANNETGAGWMNFPGMVIDRLPNEAILGWDAGLNGNLAEQLIEPTLLGAYEGAAITVLGKGVKFPTGTALLDAYGAVAGAPASFPTGTTLLTARDCAAYPTNYYCNPSSIDGLTLRNSSQGGGGIFVHAFAHNLQIANNRVTNNQGTMSGGISVGTGDPNDVQLAGQAVQVFPGSCETSPVTNQSLPFCFNTHVNIHNNAVVSNASLGDEIFSSTPAGAGGVSFTIGSDYYTFTNNWVCGNLSSGDGGGVSHIGFSKNGLIAHNTIIFNQSTNPTITTNGGGLLVMGAPDADPTTCGVSTDQDCLAPPGTILPSDGTGQLLTVDANLILGNAADSGSGGGVRIQHVNGTDVLNNPNGASLCSADLATCAWNSVSLTNNIIVNNVAGWDGGGVSLLDALATNIVNNTIASNDSTASSGSLFQSLFAPLASSVAPTTNVVGSQCGATNGQSCPQVAGLVSVSNSPVLQANIGLLPANTPLTCPAGHGVAIPGGQPSCYYNSIPLLFNDAIWQNRSFYIGVGGLGSVAANQNQQHVVTLYPAGSTTPLASQTATGGCPTGASYWDLGFRGDTAATSHAAAGFAPTNSVFSAASATTYGGANNANSSPSFVSQYCNGSRMPPEMGGTGYQVPPGVNEFNAFPNPAFTLTPAGVVDEGNNWVNVRWGPLALTSPATNVVLGVYAPTGTAATSSAIDHGVASVTVGNTTVAAPKADFYGNPRPTGSAYDIGAVELQTLGFTPNPLNFGNQDVLTTGTAVLRLSNPLGAPTVTGITLQALAGTNAADFAVTANGCAGITLPQGASCTITVSFKPSLLGTRTATLSVTDSQGTQSATLTGTGTGPLYSVTPNPLQFPNTVVGKVSAVQTLSVRNNQTVPMTFSGASLGGLFGAQYQLTAATTCSAAPIASGGTCVIALTFNPQAVLGLGGIRPAILSLTASGLTTNVGLNGTAILFPVDVTPKGIFGINGALPQFANTQVGQASGFAVATLSNYQSTPVTVNSIVPPSQFQVVNGAATTCQSGTVLPAAAADGTPTSCTLAVRFTPNAQNLLFGFINLAWVQSATFNLAGSGGINPTLSLSGTALASAITGSGAFGNQPVGTTSASQSFTYTNSGATPVTLTAVTLTGDYAIVSNTCSGTGTLPVAAGGTCTVGVTFTPSAAGNRTATLTFTDTIGSQAVALSGNGTQAAVTFTGPAPVLTTTTGNLTTKNGVITVRNSGTAPLTLSATVAPSIAKISGTGTGTASIQPGGTCSLGGIVAAGATCTINVRWAPTNTLTANLAVTITDSGAATTSQTSATFPAN